MWSTAYVASSRLNQNGNARVALPAGSITIWRPTTVSSTSVPSSSRGSTALSSRPNGTDTNTVSAMISAIAPYRTSRWSARTSRKYGVESSTPTVQSASSRPSTRCRLP